MAYVCVLAGGCCPDGTVNAFVERRLELAQELLADESKNVLKIIILGGGTFHKPPFVDIYGMVKHESTACAEYLMQRGVDANKIFREWGSYDTIANGYLCFLQFVVPLQIETLYVVTSDFHLDRARSIFEYFQRIFRVQTELVWNSSVSSLPLPVFEKRSLREKASAIQFREEVSEVIDSVNAFAEWFYTRHRAYVAIVDYASMEKADDAVLDTY
jgi:hypothetical protein